VGVGHTLEAVGNPSGVYRTAGGLVFRVEEQHEGALLVEVLRHGVWVPGRLQIIGLRLEPTTTKLSPAAIAALPD
jgi:hypothetical protein